MQTTTEGALSKMRVERSSPVNYRLTLGSDSIPMNELLGQTVRIEYTGMITCCHCGRQTKKSFNQGYCFPCFKKLAQCDSCIVSPEKCHYFAGTCREPEWADQHCMQSHIVYLANSSGVKVGITRINQLPTRWIDQGAVQALPIFRVANRLQSGLVEVLLKEHVADKTNWQAMLKGPPESVDLIVVRDGLVDKCQSEIGKLQEQFGLQAIQFVTDAAVVDISYPVLAYPTKVKSFNLDRNAVVEGCLMGIKGQYLILDTGVINIRKFGSYHVRLTA